MYIIRPRLGDCRNGCLVIRPITLHTFCAPAELVKQLLEAGDAPNVSYGLQPLHLACMGRVHGTQQVRGVQYLCAAHAAIALGAHTTVMLSCYDLTYVQSSVKKLLPLFRALMRSSHRLVHRPDA
jgi:hypothetical protein